MRQPVSPFTHIKKFELYTDDRTRHVFTLLKY